LIPSSYLHFSLPSVLSFVAAFWIYFEFLPIQLNVLPILLFKHSHSIVWRVQNIGLVIVQCYALPKNILSVHYIYSPGQVLNHA